MFSRGARRSCLLSPLTVEPFRAMVAQAPDPNRYVVGIEAQHVRARLETERAILEVTDAARIKARRSLDNAEAEVREQKAVLARLEERRDAHAAFLYSTEERHELQQAVVDAQRVLLHPIRKIPLDILARIFVQCQPNIKFHPSDHYNITGELIRRAQTESLNLAAVCRRWRLAALSSARCWSQVCFYLDEITGNGMCKALYETVLERSASTPLSVILVRWGTAKAEQQGAVNTIKSALSRCVALIVDVKLLEADDAVHSILSSPAPKLKYARLIVDDVSELSPNVVWLPDASFLRSLNIDGCLISYLKPSSHLTSLVL